MKTQHSFMPYSDLIVPELEKLQNQIFLLNLAVHTLAGNPHSETTKYLHKAYRNVAMAIACVKKNMP